jgi:hypothetical protein
MEYIIGSGYLGSISNLLKKHKLGELDDLVNILDKEGFDYYILENLKIFVSFPDKYITTGESDILPIDNMKLSRNELDHLEAFVGSVKPEIRIGRIKREPGWFENLGDAMDKFGSALM